MKVVRHDDVPLETFPGGATYQTLVGDDAGSTPVRTGIQVSPPGYATPDHSHPYVEVITVLDGEGEAWSEASEAPVALHPGVTLVIPPGTRHGFRVTGKVPLRTLGVHASPDRIVEIHEAGEAP
jgi:quercetin dioxygenase-like cupin family protein